MARRTQALGTALAALIVLVQPAAAGCYTQRWSNASRTNCDDGTVIRQHGTTYEVDRPDGSDETIEDQGNRATSSDGTTCTTLGSYTSCD